MAKKIKTSASNPNIIDDPLAKIQAQQTVLPENFSVEVLPSLKKVQDTLASKPLPVKASKVKISADFEDELRLKKEEKLGLMNATPLMKSVVSLLDQEGFSRDSTATIERLAFEINPHFYSQYSSVFIPKEHLVPDFVLKRIAVQDELVASIVRVRATQIGSFGRHQIDRFATGFRIQPMPGILEKADEKQKKEIQDRITEAVKKLLTCGETKGLSYKERTTLAQFLYIQARNAVVLGRFATEILWVDNPKTNKRIFHSFRPIDVGTLYKAVPQKSQVDTVRLEARNMLEALKNKRLEPEKFVNDEYAWVQVIDAQPVQAFGPEECVVFDCYPTADIEFGGYPVTPIDTCIASITTHMNIVSHNKIYFQSGRASRGILVIRSEDVDIPTINMIRQQFNNSINSVTNSWRMPVFAMSEKDKVEWVPIDMAHRDQEFAFLSDNNARTIFSAFQMSPEEVPGYGHLARGTLSQGMSESNNEYKLEAARDVGIRPLLAQFQDFLNKVIFPLIDKELSEICVMTLAGLDADTQERENEQLTNQAPLHMTYNEVLQKVEKNVMPHELGGDFPFNAQYQQVLDRYFTVGEIKEAFFGCEGASKDPTLAYYRDEYWMNWQTTMLQKQQMDQQSQMAQEQAQAQQQSAGAQQMQQEAQNLDPNIQDIGSGVDQLLNFLGKNQSVNLTPNKKKLLAQHRLTVKNVMQNFEKDSKGLLANLTKVALENKKKK